MLTSMRRTGRPSKGDRVVLYSRPERRVRQAVEKSATQNGYSNVSDYVAAILAIHEGLADLAPRPDSDTSQQELPMNHTA